MFLYGYDTETATKEVENYDKLRSFIESHSMQMRGQVQGQQGNERRRRTDSEVTEGMNEDYEENNFDDDSGDVGRNMMDGNDVHPSGMGVGVGVGVSRLEMLCTSIVPKLEALEKLEAQRRKHDWCRERDIKMLLTPESPPDTPPTRIGFIKR